MAKKSDNGGCGSLIGVAVILGLVFVGIRQCTSNIFGGGNSNNEPRTHKVEKKAPKKKNLTIHLYNYNYEIKKQIPIEIASQNKQSGFKLQIRKAYQLPLKQEEGFSYTRTGSAKFMTKRLYRIYVKATVPVKYDAKLGKPTLIANNKKYQTYSDNQSEFTSFSSAEYANGEYLFGIDDEQRKESKITLNVPVYAMHKGNTVETYNSSTTFNVR